MQQVSNVSQMLLSNVGNFGNKVAYIFGSTSITFQELHDQTFQLATYLRARGVEPRQHILIAATDSINWVKYLHAIILIGAVPVLISFKTDFNVLKQIAIDTDCVSVFANPDILERLPDTLIKFSDSDANLVTAEKYTDVYEYRPDETAAFFCTSGTTAQSKLVEHPHKSLIYAINELAAFKITESSTVICTPPLSFAVGFIFNCLASLIYKSTHMLTDSAFSLAHLPDYINRYKATNLIVSVTAATFLTRSKVKIGSHLQSVLTGSEPVPPAMATKFEEVVGVPLTNWYGTSEGLISVICENDGKWKSNRIGTPCRPGVVVKLVDEVTDEPVPANTVGRLVFKTNTIANGYYNDPKSTAYSFRNGWIYTDDLAYRDNNGDYYFVGRIGQYVKIRGRFASASEIENLILGINGIDEVTVVFDQDEDGLNIAKAFIICEPGVSLTKEEIRSTILKANNGGHLVPRDIYFVKQLPKTVTTKKIRSLSLLEEAAIV